MNILKRINKMRLQRKWSIYRLSVESGVSQSTLTNMFNRETLPSITTLECLCNAFGITMSQFFAENNELAAVSDEERQLVDMYRSLSSETKKNVSALIRELSSK